MLLNLHRAASVDGLLKGNFAVRAYSVALIVADGDVQIHDVFGVKIVGQRILDADDAVLTVVNRHLLEHVAREGAARKFINAAAYIELGNFRVFERILADLGHAVGYSNLSGEPGVRESIHADRRERVAERHGDGANTGKRPFGYLGKAAEVELSGEGIAFVKCI